MRNLSFNVFKCEKKYFFALIITVICAIISGIVLYKVAGINSYFKNYAQDYIFYVFNFKNGKLLFSHLITELIYLYAVFLLAYCTGIKYLSLILIYIRGLFVTAYLLILIAVGALGGIFVALLVFLPVSLISILLCFAVSNCKKGTNKLIYFLPAIFALVNTIIMLLLVNIIFRVVIIIV